MKKASIFFLATLLFCVGTKVRTIAQTASARLDTNIILLGDQIGLHLELQIPNNHNFSFPLFTDTITKNIEVIESGKIDTLIQGSEWIITQRLIITSFDSGFHVLPPIPFLYHTIGDTNMMLAESYPLLLEVRKVEIDAASDIMDIKDIMKAPWTFAEIWPYLLGVVLLGLIIFTIIYLIKNRHKKNIFFPASKPALPPHIEALKALEELKKKKLWQNNFIKDYYTGLTDIIRIYIERTSEISAMEMTSDEIISALRKHALEDALIENLKVVFTTADLVKFAKHSPLSNEHDTCFQKCLEYVKLTAPRPQENQNGHHKHSNHQDDIDSSENSNATELKS